MYFSQHYGYDTLQPNYHPLAPATFHTLENSFHSIERSTYDTNTNALIQTA